jgi:two-component system, LytTR family, sensor kinase
MKGLFKMTRLQLMSFLFSMPIIDFLVNYIMYDNRIFKDFRIWLIAFPLIFILGFFSFTGHVIIANLIRKKYPLLQQAKYRIAILAFCLIPFMSFSVLVIFWLFNELHILGYTLSSVDLRQGFFIGFSVNLIFETLYEADYALEKYKEGVEENKQMQQLSVHQEFATLKSQVNPHFLFNCFNTLSSLISEDKSKAEQFLNELSKVYRYLLHNNQNELSTVENEIKFIQSYFKLLQTRHGEAVVLNVEIDKRYRNYLLPSLSLQLLVENVVKHNALSKSKPLVIDIFTTAGNRLVINNNLQRRTVKAPSNKVGLDNIRMKYELLKQGGFQVLEDDKNFTVVLPLIWNNLAELKSSELANPL